MPQQSQTDIKILLEIPHPELNSNNESLKSSSSSSSIIQKHPRIEYINVRVVIFDCASMPITFVPTVVPPTQTHKRHHHHHQHRLTTSRRAVQFTIEFIPHTTSRAEVVEEEE